jgi:hypothetical protein
MDRQAFLDLLGESFFWNYFTSNFNADTMGMYTHCFVINQLIDHDSFQWWADYLWNYSTFFYDNDGQPDQSKYDAFMAHQPA